MAGRATGMRFGAALGVTAVALALAAPASSLAATRTKRASVDSSGAQSLGSTSGSPVISANGRYVAFESDANDLAATDSNDTDDIYVHDRRTGHLRRVSVRTSGGGGNGESEAPAISASGRFVAFESDSTLVRGDHNHEQDIFVRDIDTSKTTRVSSRTRRRTGGRPELGAGHLGQWAIRRLRLPGDDPRAPRHARVPGRVRPRSQDGPDEAGERRSRRERGGR